MPKKFQISICWFYLAKNTIISCYSQYVILKWVKPAKIKTKTADNEQTIAAWNEELEFFGALKGMI